MPPSNWEQLVVRCCPTGMRVCNCRQAYETLYPKSAIRVLCGTQVDLWCCAHGCSAAQIAAKEIVATKIVEEQSNATHIP